MMLLRFYSDTNFDLAKEAVEGLDARIDYREGSREMVIDEEDYHEHFQIFNDVADKYRGDFYG